MKTTWMKQENHINYGLKDLYMNENYKIKKPNNNDNNNVASLN
jgi:hypothetical protein